MKRTSILCLPALALLALTTMGCSTREKSICDKYITCEGGNDADKSACVDNWIQRTQIAGAYNCGDAWSKYLDAALNDFIEDTDVVIAQHHWPTWGRERARSFIAEQRDLYRLMHDQTLRLMSHGLTPHEIAEAFRLPASLEKRWHVRPC